MRKRGLGRGLDALLPPAEGGPREGDIREIPVKDIVPNRLQPRHRFDPDRLAELAASIKQHGVVQPVIVRKVEGGYELVVGERRWRAARQAGLATIPAVVKDVTSDGEVMAVALVENLQREDLNPLEEASAYQYLVHELGLTQEEVAERVGRSRSQVANTLRLLNLDPEIQEEIQAGGFSMGHAKVVLSLPDRQKQMRLFRLVMKKGLSVRQAEEEARKLLAGERPRRQKEPAASPFAEIEARMRDALGTRVVVKGKATRGRVEIEYYSAEDLDRIVDLISRSRS